MSTCNLDHSQEEVLRKLENQSVFLPELLAQELKDFLSSVQEQSTLNEVFHLLKKYDLITDEEREQRNLILLKLIR